MPNRDKATTGSGLLNEVIEFHGGLKSKRLPQITFETAS